MRITRPTWVRLAILAVVSVIAFSFMVFDYMKLPQLLFGLGEYTVRVQLPQSGGLYARANVTYRGTEVGLVKDVQITDTGVEAVLQLDSDVAIPSNLRAEVHSQTAVGEQYVALLPEAGQSPPLKNGDVIPRSRTSVPPDVNTLLDDANRGLQAIPRDNLKTTIDEAYVAFGGLGPELSRFIKGSTTLAIDARNNLDALTNVVDNVGPILDTQTDTSDAVQAWAAHVASLTGQLQTHDAAVRGVLQKGAPAADEVRALFQRLQPTLPIVLANLVSLGQVAVTYRDNIEQILVLLPQGTAAMQGINVPNRGTKQGYKGAFLSFNLNLNVPAVCNTGFLPAQQVRSNVFEDYPDRIQGDLYCRIPQDSMNNVRGARNTPCVTRPGKRAPTVKMCESDENYVPLNDGFNWKGDPNATLSGQDVPQLSPEVPSGAVPPVPGAPPPAAPPGGPPPIAAAEYDPATGTYMGPDGKVYTQSNLAQDATKDRGWQDMLLPPAGK